MFFHIIFIIFFFFSKHYLTGNEFIIELNITIYYLKNKKKKKVFSSFCIDFCIFLRANGFAFYSLNIWGEKRGRINLQTSKTLMSMEILFQFLINSKTYLFHLICVWISFCVSQSIN